MIRNVEVRKNKEGNPENVRVTFGPHHFVEVSVAGEKVAFSVGATHHGFKADASIVNSELERICNEVRRSHPGSCID